MPGVAEFFDRLAPQYDTLWTNSAVGSAQREAVWRHIDSMVHPGSRVLDLGCGTGEDALHLTRRGAHVDAIDISEGMIQIARAKGVDARTLPVEKLTELRGHYDFVFSNFGAINCIADLSTIRDSLGRLVHPQGTLAICVMNRLCAWETAYFTGSGRFSDAKRRWSGQAKTSSGWAVFYPTKKQICRSLAPQFRLKADVGIGLCVPPSYVKAVPRDLLRLLAVLDRSIERIPVIRSLGDHRLLIFTRV